MTEDHENKVAETAAPPRSRPWRRIGLAAIGVVVLDIFAGLLFPQPGFPGDIGAGIIANIEPIPPKTVIDLAPNDKLPDTAFVITAHPSITTTLFTMWLIMAVIVLLAWLMTRHIELVPGRIQNFLEFAIQAASDFVTDVGGRDSRRYIALFGSLFVFILLSNWTDLLLFGEKSDLIRTPTSDINITFGLALVSFCTFHFEGVRKMGARRYLGKFFSLSGFKQGAFTGFMNLYIGVLEFFLEFFKPLTLAVRLFGNIYGGGVMLGVMTALLVAILPLPFLALEGFVGFVQALVFALLTLMFTLTALEVHEEEEHGTQRPGRDQPEGDITPPDAEPSRA